MKKHFLVCFSLLTTITVSAQEVVSTQGDTYTSANAIVDFTIGEVVIDTGTDGTNDVTQGFHQTNWHFAGLEDHDQNYWANVFPNPLQETMNIHVSEFEGVSYSLVDANGKIVSQKLLTAKETAIKVNHLARGSYSLLLSKENQSLKTFKLTKIK